MKNPVKTAKGIVHALRVIRDPNRLNDLISFADELVRPEFLRPVVEFVSRDPQGASAFRDRPRVHLDLAALQQFAAGTLGREFAEHMIANRLDPRDLPTRQASSDTEYVRAHLFEVHDLWHVVTGFRTDIAGELGLQAFYLAQFPSRFAAAVLAGGLLNTLLYAFDERDRRMDAITKGWAMGRGAKLLFGARWDELLMSPLTDVRARFELTAVA
jgi:ubiquinone biosynthesis protein COQ4